MLRPIFIEDANWIRIVNRLEQETLCFLKRLSVMFWFRAVPDGLNGEIMHLKMKFCPIKFDQDSQASFFDTQPVFSFLKHPLVSVLLVVMSYSEQTTDLSMRKQWWWAFKKVSFKSFWPLVTVVMVTIERKFPLRVWTGRHPESFLSHRERRDIKPSGHRMFLHIVCTRHSLFWFILFHVIFSLQM